MKTLYTSANYALAISIALLFVISDETLQFALFCGKDIAFSTGLALLTWLVFTRGSPVNNWYAVPYSLIVGGVLALSATDYLPDAWRVTQEAGAYVSVPQVSWLIIIAVLTYLNSKNIKRCLPALAVILLASLAGEPWDDYYEYLIEHDVIETGDPNIETKEMSQEELLCETWLHQSLVFVGYQYPVSDINVDTISSTHPTTDKVLSEWLISNTDYQWTMNHLEHAVISGQAVTDNGYHKAIGNMANFLFKPDGETIVIEVTTAMAINNGPRSNLTWIFTLLAITSMVLVLSRVAREKY